MSVSLSPGRSAATAGDVERHCVERHDPHLGLVAVRADDTPVGGIQPVSGQHACLDIDEPHERHADLGVGRLLAEHVVAARRRGKDLADPVGHDADQLVSVNPLRRKHRADELLCGLLAEIDRVPVAARVEHPCAFEIRAYDSQQVGDHALGAQRPVRLRRPRHKRSCCGFRDPRRIRWLGIRPDQRGHLSRTSRSTTSWDRRTRPARARLVRPQEGPSRCLRQPSHAHDCRTGQISQGCQFETIRSSKAHRTKVDWSSPRIHWR